MDEPEESPTVKLIPPDPEKIRTGAARLEECLPHWRQTPALLVIKPDLGVVVSVLDCEHDTWGFLLRLGIQEKLVAPPDFDSDETSVRCFWNQPYLSFSREDISAPYSFYLHFGADGVSRACEIHRLFCEAGASESPPEELARFRWCFGMFGDQELANVKAELQRISGEEQN